MPAEYGKQGPENFDPVTDEVRMVYERAADEYRGFRDDVFSRLVADRESRFAELAETGEGTEADIARVSAQRDRAVEDAGLEDVSCVEDRWGERVEVEGPFAEVIERLEAEAKRREDRLYGLIRADAEKARESVLQKRAALMERAAKEAETVISAKTKGDLMEVRSRVRACQNLFEPLFMRSAFEETGRFSRDEIALYGGAVAGGRIW